KIDSLLKRMTLKEKCALLSGKDNWRTVPIERLGIGSLIMTDGPHGVRATEDSGRMFAPATSFPTGVSMAATWDPSLIEKVAEALAEETRTLGCDILLGPCVNIVRHPLAGRNFESYSEDPYLAGQIGIAWVKGLQRKGVGASLKHYACNNQEDDRFRGSSEVDERTLREIYLPQFETIVKEANPWTVMCSYNRINGFYASEHTYLLKEILKGEWGYEGMVVSDWGANHTIFESVQGGLDLEMPGPAKYYGRLLEEAVNNWQIEEADVDEAARRVLRMLVKAGKLKDSPPPAGKLNTPEHQALACQLAEESITLLKNEGGLLPLDLSAIKSVAVIGPMAAIGSIGGGGSSFVQPPYRISPLQALQEKLGDTVKIQHAQGCDNFVELPALGPSVLKPSSGKGQGLRGLYYDNPDFSGKPVLDRVDASVDFWWLSFAPLAHTPPAYSVRWTGKLVAAETGRHTLLVRNTGTARVFIDGELRLENVTSHTDQVWPMPTAILRLDLVKGKSHDLQIEFIRPTGVDFPHIKAMFAYTPAPEDDDRLERAVALAGKSDIALVFVGWPEGYESEGRDRPSIDLTGPQDELVRRVAAANPNTVVVLNCGSPVAMPWVAQVPAIVEAYYPGQEGGRAVANVLLGHVNPSGKLTVTFPKRLSDTPAFTNFGPGREVIYGEGIFVGYRHYDLRQVEPLFPFGHGLSYTTFSYSKLKVPTKIKAGKTVQVSLKVTNTGDRPGKEIVQLYVADKQASLPRPPKELKGFAKVSLQPGETQEVTFDLNQRAFAFYDPVKADWVVEPGAFRILVGASAQDIRLKAKLVISAA
ncbi:MAG: glycoside hydrolase family 3 C-terminal domain-containing protein, partial [Anaerolineales bacterium]|nr:glycoside hydrolase family 3 C-terminal domain-containing protein [Anaerolineales bacterium]